MQGEMMGKVRADKLMNAAGVEYEVGLKLY
jgi:hypothetical protein